MPLPLYSLSSSFLSNCDKSIFDIRPMLSIRPFVPRSASAIGRLRTPCHRKTTHNQNENGDQGFRNLISLYKLSYLTTIWKKCAKPQGSHMHFCYMYLLFFFWFPLVLILSGVRAPRAPSLPPLQTPPIPLFLIFGPLRLTVMSLAGPPPRSLGDGMITSQKVSL